MCIFGSHVVESVMSRWWSVCCWGSLIRGVLDGMAKRFASSVEKSPFQTHDVSKLAVTAGRWNLNPFGTAKQSLVSMERKTSVTIIYSYVFFVLSVEIKNQIKFICKRQGLSLSEQDLTKYSVHLFWNSKKNLISFFQQTWQKILFTWVSKMQIKVAVLPIFLILPFTMLVLHGKSRCIRWQLMGYVASCFLLYLWLKAATTAALGKIYYGFRAWVPFPKHSWLS